MTASDTFIARFVGVKGTPQHRSPNHETRMPSSYLNCLAPQGFRLLESGGWATTSPLSSSTQLTRPESVRGGPTVAGGPETVQGTGAHVGEGLMLRIPGDHEHSDAWPHF